MKSKIAFDPRCVDRAAGLILKIPVSSDMIRMRMRIEDRFQGPAVRIKDLTDLFSGILVISAVDQTDFRLTGFDQSDLCRTLNIIAAFSNLNQFVHVLSLLSATGLMLLMIREKLRIIRDPVLVIIIFDRCLDRLLRKNRTVELMGRQSVKSFRYSFVRQLKDIVQRLAHDQLGRHGA